ncbi:hypothetical protein ACLBXO_05300 [Methylobacterium sp. C33D]
MSELKDFVAEFAGEGGSLPLVHTTDRFTLQAIRDSSQIKVTEDKVYPGESLIYMFYGRPSFRVNSEVKHTTASFFAPVCLVFDRDLLNTAYRIMPFDSGAHAAGMLKETIHKRMEREKFELEVSPESPMKLIRCFYGSEQAYLENSPQTDGPTITEIQNEQKHYVEAYYHLVHHRSNSAQDERVNSIEVQFDKDIEIVGNLQAVIIPSRFYSKEIVAEVEKEFNATVIVYDMPASYRPSELMNTIYEKLYNFVQGKRQSI